MSDPAVTDPALATLLKSAAAPPLEEFLLISAGDRARIEGRMPSVTEHWAKTGRKTFYWSLWF